MALMKNDVAVSPVIGTILMVAVTVILAAIIASFVFGSAGHIQKTRVVATTVQLETSGSIIIIYQGGQDSDSLMTINITAPNGTIWHPIDAAGTLVNSGFTYAKPDIGSVMKLYPAADWPTGQKHTLVVGTFGDGSKQVMTDSYV